MNNIPRRLRKENNKCRQETRLNVLASNVVVGTSLAYWDDLNPERDTPLLAIGGGEATASISSESWPQA